MPLKLDLLFSYNNLFSNLSFSCGIWKNDHSKLRVIIYTKRRRPTPNVFSFTKFVQSHSPVPKSKHVYLLTQKSEHGYSTILTNMYCFLVSKKKKNRFDLLKDNSIYQSYLTFSFSYISSFLRYISVCIHKASYSKIFFKL